MYNVQSIHYKQIFHDRLESIKIPSSIVYLGKNVLTLGIYGTIKTLSKGRRIKELTLIYKNLRKQATDLMSQWKKIEKELFALLNQLNDLNYNNIEGFNYLKSKLEKLSLQKELLQKKSLKSEGARIATISNSALAIIALISQSLVNIFTFGIYGIYRNRNLEKQIIVLEIQNQHAQDSFEKQKKDKNIDLQKIINIFKDYLTTKQTYESLRKTIKGKAYFAEQQTKFKLMALQKNYEVLEKKMRILEIQKNVTENNKQAVECELIKKEKELVGLYDRLNNMENREWQWKQERDNLVGEFVKMKGEFKELIETKDKEIAHLQSIAKANRVQILEKELNHLQAVQKQQSEVIKLIPQLGSITPKYITNPQDGLVLGAMDIDDIRNELIGQPEKVIFAEGYNDRYGKQRTASEVVIAGFQYAFDQLINIASQADKIKFNKSGDTPGKPAEYVVYRYMILDILQGGKIDDNGCYGFKLKINENVSMLPSIPERILQNKNQQFGELQPKIVVRYKQRDDFTPDEEALGLRDGVNPIAAKWILEKLNEKEKEYLFTHLMAPVIENKHPDYQRMISFMRDKYNPRVKLIETASELIQDMGTAIQKKFGKTLLVNYWREKANDWDIPPFVKPEDDQKGLDKIPDYGLVQAIEKTNLVNWEADPNVLGDKGLYDIRPNQQSFYKLIASAIEAYKIVFENLDTHLLKHPQIVDREFKKLNWSIINEQYHVAHQMIGADFNGEGGDRCLFSNLLAILVMDKAHLTRDNVRKLKRAMANYLDKLQFANSQWFLEEIKPVHLQSKDMLNLKESAELFKAFEQAIKKTHHCTIASYQAWLRNDIWGAANINLSDLTPLEIQLAAYTIGVRIGLLPINMDGITKVDKFGRILPVSEIYGPNTKEILLMGVWDPLDERGGTYYALFPKLKIAYNQSLENNPIFFEAALNIESYWASIDINRRN